METKKFSVIIEKRSTVLGLKLNEHILGRITGFMYVICERPNMNNKDHVGYAMTEYENCIMLRVDCTEEQYEKFKTITEECYPGLCCFEEIVSD